jgi:peptidoglycan hydrolase CwlO-like protein
MESMNKFKVLTAIIICLFIFVVAAIYTNTKDVSEKNNQPETVQKTSEKVIKEVEYADDDFAQVVKNVDRLTRRIDDLASKINESETNGNTLKCKILGTLTNDGVEEASPDFAIREAKDNNIPLVITCRL